MRRRHQLRAVGPTGDDRAVVYQERTAGARTEAPTSPIGEGLPTRPHRLFRQDKVPDLKHAPRRRGRGRRCDVTGGLGLGGLIRTGDGFRNCILPSRPKHYSVRPFGGSCFGRREERATAPSQWCSVVLCGAVRRNGGSTQQRRCCRAGWFAGLGSMQCRTEQSRQWSKRKHDDQCNVEGLRVAVEGWRLCWWDRQLVWYGVVWYGVWYLQTR